MRLQRTRVCVLRDGIRAAAEPSSTALTESRSWLEPRQLDEGHRLERQRRCGKNIHNYVPLNAVTAWIIDTPCPATRSRNPVQIPVSPLHRFFACPVAVSLLGNSVRLEIGTRFRVGHLTTLRLPCEFFYFRASTHREIDRPTAIPEQSSPRVAPLFAACAAACVINALFVHYLICILF